MVKKTNSHMEKHFPEFIDAPDKIYNLLKNVMSRPVKIKLKFRKSQRFLYCFEYPQFLDIGDDKIFEFSFDKDFYIKCYNCIETLKKDYEKAHLIFPEIDIIFLNQMDFILSTIDYKFFNEKNKTNWFTSLMNRMNFARNRI